MSLLGTFIVRSGFLTSVHSFASDPTRGMFIFSFLIVAVGGALLLFALLLLAKKASMRQRYLAQPEEEVCVTKY